MITMNIVAIRDDESDVGIKNLRNNTSDGSEIQANRLQSHPPPELNYTYLSNKSHSWRADDSCSPLCLLFKFHGIFSRLQRWPPAVPRDEIRATLVLNRELRLLVAHVEPVTST